MMDSDPFFESIKNATEKILSLINTNDDYELNRRCPNEKEQKDYLIQKLRSFCYNRKNGFDPLTTQQYRSIKGQIKHGHFENAFNFFKNREENHIKREFEDYCNYDCILDIKIPITFPEPVTVYSLELNLNNEEETSHGQKT